MSEEIAFRIALEINERLKNIGMPKKNFAKSLGVSRPYVSQILQGENNMTILTICKIADALGMRPVIQLRDEIDCSNTIYDAEAYISTDNPCTTPSNEHTDTLGRMDLKVTKKLSKNFKFSN